MRGEGTTILNYDMAEDLIGLFMGPRGQDMRKPVRNLATAFL